MTVYWANTKSIAKFKEPMRTPERDKIITDTFGVDPSMLVKATGMSVANIKAYQRKLGLRKFTNHRKKKDVHPQSDN